MLSPRGRGGKQRRSSIRTAQEEALLRMSLGRARRRGDWRAAALILSGWLLHWLLFGTMATTLLLYNCQFLAHTHAGVIEAELIWSWLWAMFQRWAINEPLLILLLRLMPLLLKASTLQACCGERVVGGIQLFVETLSKMARALSV